jgi:hypothetical protein
MLVHVLERRPSPLLLLVESTLDPLLSTRCLPSSYVKKLLIKTSKSIPEVSAEGILSILTCCERERKHRILLMPRLRIKDTWYIRNCGLRVSIVGGRVGAAEDKALRQPSGTVVCLGISFRIFLSIQFINIF